MVVVAKKKKKRALLKAANEKQACAIGFSKARAAGKPQLGGPA